MKTMKTIESIFLAIVAANLSLFDGNMNLNKTTDTTSTTGNDLSPEMKTFYSKYLITEAEPELLYQKFGQKKDIPANNGKNIEFRKYSKLPTLTTPLTEGVTPDGQKLNVSTVTATVQPYGGYVALTDELVLTAIDNNVLQAGKLLAAQAGRTLNDITRDALNAGTTVSYAHGKTSRLALVGGDATAANNDYLSFDDVRKAARIMKVNLAGKINGDYVGFIHPNVAYAIKGDTRWVDVKQYSDPKDIYEGEIGKIEGIRFIEDTEAKVFRDDLTAGARTLTVKTAISSSTTTVAVDEEITTADAAALAGRKIYIGTSTTANEIVSASAAAAGSATITLKTAISSAAKGASIYGGNAGAGGRPVYSTLIVGADAYGVTKVEGGGLKMIVKQLGSGGSSDPLDQRATVGWKAMHTAEILLEESMVRIESTSEFD